MNRNQEVRVKMSKEEHEKILKKARLSGMPISTFLRTLGLKSQVEVS